MKSINNYLNRKFKGIRHDCRDYLKYGSPVSDKLLREAVKPLRNSVRIFDPWYTRISEIDGEKLIMYAKESILSRTKFEYTHRPGRYLRHRVGRQHTPYYTYESWEYHRKNT